MSNYPPFLNSPPYWNYDKYSLPTSSMYHLNSLFSLASTYSHLFTKHHGIMKQPCNFEYMLNDPYVRFVYSCRIWGIQKVCMSKILLVFCQTILTYKKSWHFWNLTLYLCTKLSFERPHKLLPLFVYVVFECSQLGDDQGNDCILSDYKLCLLMCDLFFVDSEVFCFSEESIYLF